ncbi:MAG: sulfotransferase family 2 domain-containing protein [Paracoccaceae bacterium]
MISLVHRTLFVHVPKCAGQSVEQAFCEDLGLRWGKHRHLLGCMQRPGTWSKAYPGRLAHITAHQYTALDFCPQEMFDNFYKFAVVRDPVQRIVSMWRYLETELGFDEFVAEFVPEQLAAGHFFYQPQHIYLCAPQTQTLLVDHLIPFSRLAEEWPDVQRRSGIRAPLGHRNKSDGKAARPEVSAETCARIEEIYADDYALIDTF